MSPFEMVLSAACVLSVGGAWWYAVTRTAFNDAMSAWAERHSEATRNKIAEAWVEGHEAGQEFARLRGSKPRG